MISSWQNFHSIFTFLIAVQNILTPLCLSFHKDAGFQARKNGKQKVSVTLSLQACHPRVHPPGSRQAALTLSSSAQGGQVPLQEGEKPAGTLQKAGGRALVSIETGAAESLLWLSGLARVC